MRWGQVRGKNGVIILEPTPHPDADTKGGHYHWKRSAYETPLPDVLRACLCEAGDCADPLTDGELDEFLDTYHGEGCGHDGCRNAMDGPVTQFAAMLEDGAGRHDTLVEVAPWAMARRWWLLRARDAFNHLYYAFAARFDEADPRTRVPTWRRVPADYRVGGSAG